MIQKIIVLFIVGCLAGAGYATVRFGQTIERLTWDNARLMDEVERLASMLDNRERALTLQRRAPVHSVEVEVMTSEQEHVRLHVEQQAHELLRPLVGEEVDQLNPSLIEKTLRRTFEVDRTDYAAVPDLIVIGQRVYVRLAIKPGKHEPANVKTLLGQF